MRFLIAVALVLVTTFAAQAQNQNQQYLFVAEPQAVEGFTINSVTGALVSTGAPTPDTSGPVALAANPAGTYLFAANYSASNVSVFSIAPSGTLTEIAGSPFSTGSNTLPSQLAVSADGNFLFVANSFSNAGPNTGELDIYSIAGDGSLAFTSEATIPSPSPAVGIIVNPSFVYVCAGTIVQPYSVSQGNLTELAALVLSNQNATACVSNGTFVFVSRTPPFSQSGYIDTLSVNAGGTLSLVASYDAGLFNSETNLALSQGYLFSNQNTYGVAPNGGLTPNNLNWINVPFTPLAASPISPFLFFGDQAKGLASGPLIYPVTVNSSGEAANSEPPLFLSGIPLWLTVAVGNTPAPSNPGLVLEPATFNFSPVTGGQTSLAQLTIYSTGNVPLTISNIAVTGSAFTEQSSTCPSSLAPSQTCFVYVNFSPSLAGSFTGTVSLTGNVSGTVPLTGTGDSIQVSTVGAGTVQQVPLGSAFAAGTAITLTATPNSGATFSGWSGACNGAALTCAFALTANSTVTATFAPNSTPPVTPSIAISPTNQSGNTGQTFQYQIAETGFATTPQLTATCSIPYGSCSIKGSTLYVSTTAPVAATLHPISLVWLLAICALAVAYLRPNRRVRVRPRVRRTALVIGMLGALAACGGTGPAAKVTQPTATPGTPQGTYSVAIAASGSTATASASLTIQ
jgi:hypothetical protein